MQLNNKRWYHFFSINKKYELPSIFIQIKKSLICTEMNGIIIMDIRFWNILNDF